MKKNVISESFTDQKLHNQNIIKANHMKVIFILNFKKSNDQVIIFASLSNVGLKH